MAFIFKRLAIIIAVCLLTVAVPATGQDGIAKKQHPSTSIESSSEATENAALEKSGIPGEDIFKALLKKVTDWLTPDAPPDAPSPADAPVPAGIVEPALSPPSSSETPWGATPPQPTPPQPTAPLEAAEETNTQPAVRTPPAPKPLVAPRKVGKAPSHAKKQAARLSPLAKKPAATPPKIPFEAQPPAPSPEKEIPPTPAEPVAQKSRAFQRMACTYEGKVYFFTDCSDHVSKKCIKLCK